MTLCWPFPVQRLIYMAVIERRWFGYEKLFNLKNLWFISHRVLSLVWFYGFQHGTFCFKSFNQILLNTVLQICV